MVEDLDRARSGLRQGRVERLLEPEGAQHGQERGELAALTRLEAEDATDHQIVMLRYFAGLTVADTADVLGMSRRSVERRWQFCRSWLARELDPRGADR